MTSSFYNGVNGIKAHDTGIAVVSNNLANINKSGFKSDRAEFSTFYEKALTGTYSGSGYETSYGGDDKAYGGVQTQTIALNLQQGYIQKSDSDLDFAIEGDGWFGIEGSNGEQYFTRQSVYNRDANGDIVDIGGNYLLGTQSKNIEDGVVVGDDRVDMSDVAEQTKINLPSELFYPAESTTEVKLKGVLNPVVKKEPDPDSGELVEVPNVERRSSDIYSAKSDARYRLDLIFTKQVPQEGLGSIWDVEATLVDPNTIVENDEGEKVPKVIDEKSGLVAFNGEGALIKSELESLDNDGTDLKINLGSVLDPDVAGSGFDGLVSTTHDYFIEDSATKNGLPSGELVDYTTDENGEIFAAFDNGKSVPVAKIALYHFQNDQGLAKVSDTHLVETANSGKPIFFKDSDDSYLTGATLLSGHIEGSNVDTAVSMTELIVMQKAYSANAKTITTSDQMLQRAINLKR